MNNIILIKLKILLLFFVSISISNELVASFIPDESICIGFRKFGSVYGTNLDDINNRLAEKERIISIALQADKKNNIVLASLSFLIKNNKKKYRFINKDVELPDSDTEDAALKTAFFESKCDYSSVPNQGLECCSKDTLDKVATVMHYVKTVWGENDKDGLWKGKTNLTDNETQIWSNFEKCQENLQRQTDDLKVSLVETTQLINTKVAQLVNLSSSLKSIGEEDIDDCSETLRNFCNSNAKPSELLQQISSITSNKSTKYTDIKKSESEFSKAVISLYRYFWHSESRLLYLLLNDYNFDEIKDDIREEEGERCVGVFLHLHSRFDMCETCRHASARLSGKEGALKNLFKEKFMPREQKAKFFFHVLASFRVRFSWQDAFNGQETWMPHNICKERIEKNDINIVQYPSNSPIKQSIFFKKIILNQSDEQESDDKYDNHIERAEAKAQADQFLMSKDIKGFLIERSGNFE